MKKVSLILLISILCFCAARSQTLTVDLGPDMLVCADSCVTVGPGSALVADGYLWSTGDTTRNISFCLTGGGSTSLILVVFDSTGNVGTDSITISEAVCTGDVWPGDANNDGVADVYDIMRIGQGFGFVGLVRPSATTNWIGQPSTNWAGSAVLDYKYADCDGNGTIEYADFQVVQLNYGLTHPKSKEPMQRSSGNPLLSITCDLDTVSAGDTVTFKIQLADDLNPVVDFYAIAFNVGFDSDFFVENVSFSDYSNNFIGPVGTVVHAFDTTFWQTGMLDLGFTKLDQTNITGYGNLANVSYILIDDIAGKTNDEFFEVSLQAFFSNVVAIKADGSGIPLDVVGDTVIVRQRLTSALQQISNLDIKVYPVPADNLLHIQLPSNTLAEQIEIYNAVGMLVKTIATAGGTTQTTVNTQELANGNYIIKIKTAEGWATSRFNIMR